MMRKYFGVESLSMTAGQRAQLHQALVALDGNDNPLPCDNLHWRIRPDGLAAIYDGLMVESEIMAQAFANYVAGVFGVSPALVTHATQQTQYGPVVTLTYLAVARLRAILFGGIDADWQTSRDAAWAYVSANLAAWQEEA